MVASSPAGAFQTPRVESVLAMMPATAPHGAKVVRRFSLRGSCIFIRGKNAAAFLLRVMKLLTPDSAAVTSFQLAGGSAMNSARRSPQYFEAASRVEDAMSVSGSSGGMHSRLKRSAFSNAKSPSLFGLAGLI